MALLTFGTVVTAGWTAFKYWRVPYRLLLWKKAKEVEPDENQIWLSAGFGSQDVKWKVLEASDTSIRIERVTEEEDEKEELYMNWESWEYFCKRSRLFCFDKGDSIADQFWGDARE